MCSERKPEIFMAYSMLRSTMDITYNYLTAKDGIPLESKLKTFDAFVDELYAVYCKARNVSLNKQHDLKTGQEPPPPP
jgi:hypothetical protein